MAAVIEGTTLQAQQSSIEADGVSGSVTLKWRGTRTELEALVISSGLNTGGHKWSIEPDEAGLAVLTWTIATGPNGDSTETDDPISTEWEITTPSEQVPISEHEDWAEEMAAFETADPDGAKVFLDYWEGDATYDDLVADSIQTEIASDYPFLDGAIDLKRRGVKGYFRGAPVLTVVDRYQRQAPFATDSADVNKVYSRDRLVSAFQSRTSGQQMPMSISTRLKDGQYLCEAITRRASSDGANEVTQVFRWAPEWSATLYPNRDV